MSKSYLDPPVLSFKAFVEPTIKISLEFNKILSNFSFFMYGEIINFVFFLYLNSYSTILYF